MHDLTPIRVRGARNGIKRRTPFATASFKRRRLAADASDSDVTVSKPKPSATSMKKLSRLEQLPLEILEAIFSHAPTADLTTASPFLGKVFSSDRVYMLYARACLLPTSGEHLPIADREITKMLRCRWMTWRKFTDIVYRMNRDPSQSREGTATPSSASSEVDKTPSPLSFGSEVYIPEKLLHGPWTKDKSDFLYYLCDCGLRIDWDTSTDGETATSGLQEAIEARDRKAVAALLSDQIMVLPTSDTLRAAVVDHGCDETIIYHVLSACIRAKARERDGRAAYGTLNANPLDPVVWSWLKRFERTSNHKAAWLRLALTKAASLMNDTAMPAVQQSEEFHDSCNRADVGPHRVDVAMPGQGGSAVV